ncbi:beta strand repeat-containing protein, partial [Flavobacterium sp. GB2R13]|uniref:beta strand repeat-containing protein n=1 Tax=Flavobacterium algoris TaxID=3398733 RepID=UPI003A864ECF
MKTFLRKSAFLTIVLFIANMFFASGAFGQILTSDQPDYAPGTTATFTGSGFQPGEQVTVIVLHYDGTSDGGLDHQPWEVTADADGNFVTTWHVCEDDCVGSTLRATADGITSGLHADVVFTDALRTDTYPSSFGTFSGGSIYCLNATASNLNVSWTTTLCNGTLNGSNTNIPITITWYKNASNLTSGGTPVQASSGVTASTTSSTYSPPTTVAGTLYYYVIVSWSAGANCALAGSITTSGTQLVTVNANNSVSLTSAVGTNAQTPCINTAITNITYNTTGATGATFSGLPAGVSGNWSANVVTISGTPTASGNNIYTVTLTGGCGAITTTGTINVSANTISLSSAAGTNAQIPCINTAITNITYNTTGATGATFSGLPAGVSGNWSANVVTISGTPTASGNNSYTVTLTGGCGTITATGTINVSANNTISLSSTAGTNTQTPCINTAITNITYNTTGATGATFSGLPTGVSGNWSANVVTISGTPTASGNNSYTVTLTGGCGTITATGTINVSANNTISLSSTAGTNTQTPCINTAITNITYNTTGATGATFSGLPAGVLGNWSANVVTISGTPTASGNNSYTVTLTGGCGTITGTGTINVRSNNTISLSSAAGTNAQTPCINTAITNITYNTTGATGATFNGLPAGVSGNWSANVVTISGIPTASGNSSYTVTLTGGCGTITATGTINVSANNTISLSSASGTNTQTPCINTAITNITYNTTGATGATFSGLPAGVSGNWSANVVTISGTPTASGNNSYTVTLTGGCGTITATGTINVSANNTISLSSTAGTNTQTPCINTTITNITYNTTGATGATFSGLPAGVSGNWSANVVTISGTPTASGNNSYTVTLTGGCGTITATGTINVRSNNTISLSSAAGTNTQTPCINTAITNITYNTTGATGATFSGLPAGVSGNWSANVVTISGTPTASGNNSYTVSLTGGCGTITETGTINVRSNNTISLSSAASTNSQTPCVNTAITNITYNTTGATGATFSGLPAGVSGNWSANVVTISGTPTASGNNSYTVTLTGGCGIITTTGTLTVRSTPTATIAINGTNPICSGSTSSIKFTGPNNGIATYNINGGGDLTATLNNGGNFILTTAALSSTTTYNLVSVKYGDAPDCSASASGSVAITVNQPPIITCPANIIVNTDPGFCSAVVNFTGLNAATATGTPTPIITYSPASGTAFAKGRTTVTATATNSCGIVSCTFTVTVKDTKVPTITAPTATTGTTNVACTSTNVVLGTPVTADNCHVASVT